MRKNEIKPCPFCNCVNVKLHRNFNYVYCTNCGARGSYFDGHPKDAINAWNRVAKKSESSIELNPSSHESKTTIADGTKGMQRG